MEMSGAEEQGKHSRHCLCDVESEQNKKLVADERGRNIDQDVCRIRNEYAADGGIGVGIVRKYGQFRDTGSDDVKRQQEQRLADSIPVVESSATAVHPKLRILIGKYWGL